MTDTEFQKLDAKFNDETSEEYKRYSAVCLKKEELGELIDLAGSIERKGQTISFVGFNGDGIVPLQFLSIDEANEVRELILSKVNNKIEEVKNKIKAL